MGAQTRMTIDSARARALTVKIMRVWAALVLATVGSWTESLRAASPAIVAAVVGLAALKVALIVFCYMEVGRAPRWLKLVCGAWIGIVFGIIAACHLLPRDVLRLIG